MPTHTAALTNPLGEVYPAAYVTARLSWHGQFRDLPGLIDSGADQTMIPNITATALGLQKISEVYVEDVNGGSQQRDVFAVDLDFHGFTVAALPVAATDYPVIVIGRDVLNDLVTRIDGPTQTFTLTS